MVTSPAVSYMKLLLQKDAREGNYIKSFYIEYDDLDGKRQKYKNGEKIATNIKDGDSKSKVFSFKLEPFEARMVRLFAIGEDNKPAAMRFDFVVSPLVNLPPQFFPKSVSMFGDRANMIQGKIWHTNTMGSEMPWATMNPGDKWYRWNNSQRRNLDIEITFREPQQVTGF